MKMQWKMKAGGLIYSTVNVTTEQHTSVIGHDLKKLQQINSPGKIPRKINICLWNFIIWYIIMRPKCPYNFLQFQQEISKGWSMAYWSQKSQYSFNEHLRDGIYYKIKWISFQKMESTRLGRNSRYISEKCHSKICTPNWISEISMCVVKLGIFFKC